MSYPLAGVMVALRPGWLFVRHGAVCPTRRFSPNSGRPVTDYPPFPCVFPPSRDKTACRVILAQRLLTIPDRTGEIAGFSLYGTTLCGAWQGNRDVSTRTGVVEFCTDVTADR
jgi:hypothetical protein